MGWSFSSHPPGSSRSTSMGIDPRTRQDARPDLRSLSEHRDGKLCIELLEADRRGRDRLAPRRRSPRRTPCSCVPSRTSEIHDVKPEAREHPRSMTHDWVERIFNTFEESRKRGGHQRDSRLTDHLGPIHPAIAPGLTSEQAIRREIRIALLAKRRQTFLHFHTCETEVLKCKRRVEGGTGLPQPVVERVFCPADCALRSFC